MKFRTPRRPRLLVPAFAALAVIAATVVASPGTASAAPGSFTVDDPVDAPDAVIDGVCATAGTGRCTLRAAVQEANAHGGPSDITFASAADNSSLTVSGPGGAEVGDLDVAPGITVRLIGNQIAANQNTVVQAGALGDRLVHVQPGGRLELQLVTLSGGSTSGDGGAVLNEGDVLITNTASSTDGYVALDSNHADGSGGAVANRAGATLTVRNLSTAPTTSRVDVTGNTATVDGGAVANVGGTVVFEGGADDAASHDVYVDTNSAVRGGGVHNAQGGTVTVSCRAFVRFSQADQGGDAFNEDGELVLTGGGLDAGRATSGGALYNDDDGSVTVTNNPDCRSGQAITRSSAVDDGGAVVNRGLIVVETETQLAIRGDDSSATADARSGAGIMAQAGSIDVEGELWVEQTQAALDGGAVAVSGGVVRTVDDGSIRVAGAVAARNGGGISVSGGSISARSSITSNLAGNLGGGISVSGGVVALFDSVILRNQAVTGGGASVASGSLDVRNSTIAENSAASTGGAWSQSGGSSLLRHDTVADNTPDGLSLSGGIVPPVQRVLMARNGGGNCVGAAPQTGDFNVFDDATCGPTGTDLTDPSRFADVAAFLEADVATGDLGSYGLSIGQPAIDFVGDGVCGDHDQIGNGRPRDGDGVGGPQCDAGSIEAPYGGVPRSISGTVRNELTGLPMPGICVYMGLIGGNDDGAMGVTGADGSYTGEVPEGEFIMAFFLPVGGATVVDDCGDSGVDRSVQAEWYRNVAVQFRPAPDDNEPTFPDLNDITRVVVSGADVSGIDACLGTGPGAGRDTPCPVAAGPPSGTPAPGGQPQDRSPSSITSPGAAAGTTPASPAPALWTSTGGSASPASAAAPKAAATALPRTGGDLRLLPVGLVVFGVGCALAAVARRRRRIS